MLLLFTLLCKCLHFSGRIEKGGRDEMNKKRRNMLEWIHSRWQSQYFRRSFLLILFITSIPGIVSGVAIYSFGLSSTEKELTKVHLEEIEERAQNIDDQLTYLEESLTYWAFEPTFNYQLITTDFIYEFQKTRDLMQKLLILEGSHPLIKEVDLYIETKQGAVIFNPYVNYINNTNEQIGYASLLTGKKNLTWDHEELFMEQAGYANEIVLTHQIPGVVKDPFGSIIVSLDKSSLAKNLETLTPYTGGVTVLLNENNDVLLTSGMKKNNPFIKELTELYRDKNIERASQLRWDNQTYSVTYGSFNRIGSEWTYLSAAPISAITTPIVTISKVILIVSFTVLAIAFFLTLFASNQLYQPVKNIVSSYISGTNRSTGRKNDEFKQIRDRLNSLTIEKQQLKDKISHQIPQLRQNFLTQLTRGYLYNFNEEALKRRMENYGWSVEGHSFVLLDIQITGMNSHHNKEDDSWLAFAMSNIADELLEGYVEQYTVLNHYDMTASIFVLLPEEINDSQQMLKSLAKDLTLAINRILNVFATITISSETNKIKGINQLFEETRRVRSYRDYKTDNQIIMVHDKLSENNYRRLQYPFEIEKEIIQSIRRGGGDETETLIREFFEQLVQGSSKEFSVNTGVQQLYSVIQHEILLSGIDPFHLYNGRNMWKELTQLREKEWIIKWFIDEVVYPYTAYLEKNVNMEMKMIVDKIVSYIEEKYMEDISLESCADYVHTTPYTLSKAFKKILGINFIDYLTRIRMDKAKSLLMDTNKKISDIAEVVGYRHSYFNRIFKKHVGITPSQFRRRSS